MGEALGLHWKVCGKRGGACHCVGCGVAFGIRRRLGVTSSVRGDGWELMRIAFGMVEIETEVSRRARAPCPTRLAHCEH